MVLLSNTGDINLYQVLWNKQMERNNKEQKLMKLNVEKQ